MTFAAKPDRKTDAGVSAQADGPASGAVGLSSREDLVPASLLGGGEIVFFAIKPSLWFVLITSLRWVIGGVLVVWVSSREWAPEGTRWYLYQAAFWLTLARLLWATLEWASRLYILTDRRAMRVRGVFNVQLFECGLDRIQNTFLEVSFLERLARIGSVQIQTAGGAGSPGGATSWDMVARPLEVHQKLREAIHKAQNRGSNGL